MGLGAAKIYIMKKFFVSLVMLLSTSVVSLFAQSSLIATLSHESEVTVFYGSDALKEAYAKAVGGDVITLSSGSFSAINISKAITLRGAGMAMDTVNNIMPTILNGDFTISESDSIHNLTLEGLYHNHTMKYSGTIESAQFIRCRFNIITGSSSNKLSNCSFLNCRISQEFYCLGYGNMFYNSIVEDISFSWLNNFGSWNGCLGSGSFYNCVINIDLRNPSTMYPGSSSFENCILIYDASTVILPKGTSAYNCLVVGTTNDIFSDVPNNTNKVVSLYSDVFKTYKTMASIAGNDDETFELTDAAKTKYLGLDGTQVGIYGGAIPYTTSVAIPKITKCNVAAKSTVDGMLSVDIEVSAE